mgnify:CR=1 FL=1
MLRRRSRALSLAQRLHAQYLIVGAGDAGVSLARVLLRRGMADQPERVKLLDAARGYVYQSGQTKVALGMLRLGDVLRPNRARLPRNAVQLETRAHRVHAAEGFVECEDGREIAYDHLVLASGVEPDFDCVRGLAEALYDPDVPAATCYVPFLARKYAALRRAFTGGTALFCQPPPPTKCPGATQKVMYVSAQDWRGLPARVEFHTPEQRLLGPEYFHRALLRVAEGYGVALAFGSELVEVRAGERVAVLRQAEGPREVQFDLLHASPAYRPGEYIARSGLASATGYADVDPATLRHRRFPNVWALGDAADLPTAKTLAAVNDQIHVVADNLLASRTGGAMHRYSGYTACPVLVDKNRVLLAEYNYNHELMPSLHKKPRPSLLAGFLYKHVFRLMTLYGLNIYFRQMRLLRHALLHRFAI